MLRPIDHSPFCLGPRPSSLSCAFAFVAIVLLSSFQPNQSNAGLVMPDSDLLYGHTPWRIRRMHLEAMPPMPVRRSGASDAQRQSPSPPGDSVKQRAGFVVFVPKQTSEDAFSWHARERAMVRNAKSRTLGIPYRSASLRRSRHIRRQSNCIIVAPFIQKSRQRVRTSLAFRRQNQKSWCGDSSASGVQGRAGVDHPEARLSRCSRAMHRQGRWNSKNHSNVALITDRQQTR